MPIVNIATPNSGGLSHNKFKDYNVNKSGLILNNATGNHHGIVRTDIGGLVVDNPNLSTKRNTVIQSLPCKYRICGKWYYQQGKSFQSWSTRTSVIILKMDDPCKYLGL